jgi:hypothetical protein
MKPLDESREKRSKAGKSGMLKRWKSEQPEQVDNNVITMLQETDNKPITELPDFITDKGEVIEENKEKPPKGGKKKEAAIAATLLREKEFYNALVPFTNRYPKEMIRKFFNYWREMNKSGSRMRFELEKTWELPLRLATWANRDKEFDKTRKNEQKQDIHI